MAEPQGQNQPLLNGAAPQPHPQSPPVPQAYQQPQYQQPQYQQPQYIQPQYQPQPSYTTCAPQAGQPTTCPLCHAQVVTQTSHEPGSLTWLAAGGICLFGGWLGCCLIPFCLESTQDTVHVCPNCRNVLGKRNRM
ncbi:lipopolysaccharide-induced tumor necrosis factor-alpha [Planoprotostelium fungivorum]|uniref:Lipopolysaccharide-induced tumor necrosis factor-alpha n=1 Tax=Planoprotostelium fungivorum TaxID=1890364 RepID=A0A2P6NIC3_9EUKA|nr:lipopolysaccharide-induced tumor necrosis factor-alpha [Planoprotostelium fungivorum]